MRSLTIKEMKEAMDEGLTLGNGRGSTAYLDFDHDKGPYVLMESCGDESRMNLAWSWGTWSIGPAIKIRPMTVWEVREQSLMVDRIVVIAGEYAEQNVSIFVGSRDMIRAVDLEYSATIFADEFELLHECGKRSKFEVKV